jgi:hypothetical protein
VQPKLGRARPLGDSRCEALGRRGLCLSTIDFDELPVRQGRGDVKSSTDARACFCKTSRLWPAAVGSKSKSGELKFAQLHREGGLHMICCFFLCLI